MGLCGQCESERQTCIIIEVQAQWFRLIAVSIISSVANLYYPIPMNLNSAAQANASFCTFCITSDLVRSWIGEVSYVNLVSPKPDCECSLFDRGRVWLRFHSP